MRNFFGVKKSSLMYQPPMFAALVVGLNNSMRSTAGRSVWVSTSLTRMVALVTAGESPAPGVPPSVLGRQLDLSPQVSNAAFSLTITSDRPRPSVIGYH